MAARESMVAESPRFHANRESGSFRFGSDNISAGQTVSHAALPLFLLVVFALGVAASLPFWRKRLPRIERLPDDDRNNGAHECADPEASGPESRDTAIIGDASRFLQGVQLVSISLLAVLLVPWMVAVGSRQVGRESFGAAFVMAGLVIAGIVYAEQTRRRLPAPDGKPAKSPVHRTAAAPDARSAEGPAK